MNTACFLSVQATVFPDQEILVFENVRLTYAQLHERVNRLANALRGLGMGRGSRIGVLDTNSSRYVEAYYATSKMGGTFVPLKHLSTPDELKHMINTAQIEVLLVGEGCVDLALSVYRDVPTVRRWIAIDRKRAEMLLFEDLIREAHGDDVEEDMDGEETNAILYTSGTTGPPKGVRLSYGSFIQYVFSTVEAADGVRWGASLVCAPLYHISGLVAVMTSLWSGRRLVLMREFETKEWLRLVERERVNHAFLSSDLLITLLDEAALCSSDLSALETLAYGALPMPVPLARRAIETFPRGVGVMSAYGQTETTGTLSILLPVDHCLEGTPEQVEKKLDRLGSIGQPLPDVELRIVDDQGQEVPRGEIGEIIVRTSRVMKGYVGLDRLTQETLIDGWVHTRDLAWMDDDGYVFLSGRKADRTVAVVGNSAPAEIETVLVYVRTDMHQQVPTTYRPASSEGGEVHLGRVHVHDIVCFLERIYSNLEIDGLRANYLSAIPGLVAASAYGIYLVESEPEYPYWKPTPATQEPLRHSGWHQVLGTEGPGRSITWSQSPAPTASRLLESAQQNLPDQLPTHTHRLARFVRVAVALPEGQLLGLLCFARPAWQPPFSYADLRTIQVVARHISVAAGHAIKLKAIRERCALLGAAVLATATAVILSDNSGRILLSTPQAQKLMGKPGSDHSLESSVRDGICRNVSHLGMSDNCLSTTAIRVPRRTSGGFDHLILRSTRISPAEATVATFLHSEQLPNFERSGPTLSKRETEILKLVARGLQDKEIARHLAVSINTVKEHHKRMFRKMGVKSRSELLAKTFSTLSET